MMTAPAPYVWVLLAAVLALWPGCRFLFGRGGPRLRPGGPSGFRLRPLRRACGLLLVCLGCTTALLALSLAQFLRLTSDAPVLQVRLQQQGPQQFLALIARSDGADSRQYLLHGDQWQVDARMVRWRLPALLAGVPPLYRLERIAGRYQDMAQETSVPKSAYALDDGPAADLTLFKRRFPEWLPFVDVQFGSAAYMPMFDGAVYRVYLDPRGALFIRPDNAWTEAGLKQRGW